MISQVVRLTIFPVVVLIITQLHLFRNVTSAYFLLYGAAFLMSIWVGISNWRLLSKELRNICLFFLLIFLFPLCSMLFGYLGDQYDSFQDLFIGVARVFFALPVYIAVLCAPADERVTRNLIFASTLITLAASISIPYQFVFGSIEWFAESSERAGLDRYASLFGSLTALGVVCGFGILAAAVSVTSTSIFALLATGIATGALLSLQKAAVVNIFLALIFVPFVRKFSLKKSILLVVFVCFLLVLVWPFFGEMLDTFISSVRISSEDESGGAGDVSIFYSVWDRISDLPSIAIDYHGWFGMLVGQGPIGGSGAFGYPDVPMSHNGIIDIFLIGGVPYFLFLAGFVAYIFKNRVAPPSVHGVGNFYRFGVVVSLGIILNATFSGLLIFTPSNAMFLSLAIKCLLVYQKPVVK